MTIREVFPNPTVKQVIFQIVFPNLFYIENKIGEFQLKMMGKFPKSSLSYRRNILFADIGPSTKITDIKGFDEGETGTKIWQFFTEDDSVALGIQNNSLDISSQFHKTYNLGDSDRFRDLIKFVLDSFLELISIPVITRIGLRYIDECPLPKKDSTTFSEYYNSAFPTSRFPLEDAIDMSFRAVVKKENYFLMYAESLRLIKEQYVLILDFDGFAKNIASKDYLTIADNLHNLISNEYERTIKSPVYDYMRQGKTGK